MAKLEIDLPACPECGGELDAEAFLGPSQVTDGRLEVPLDVIVHCLECGWRPTPAP